MPIRIALYTSVHRYENPIDHFFENLGVSLGPLYLESYLKKYAPEVEVIVLRRYEDVFAAKPDLVGISSVTHNFTLATQQAAEIKAKLGVPVVVGGAHISVLPKSLPNEIDVGVLGEGEETFLQLVRLLAKHGAFSKEHLSTIEGLVFHGEKGPTLTPRRAPIQPIDKIPRPRRLVWAENLGAAHIVSARGCPFTCLFCAESSSVYRSFGVQHIVDEIEEIVEHYGVKSVRFFDDVFNVSIKHVRALVEAIEARGLQKRVNFHVWARASTFTAEMADLFARMNIRSVAFGFESGSDAVLKLLKASTTVAQNQRAIDLCVERGIAPMGAIVIGTPGETAADLQATYDFIERNRDHLIDIEINPLVALPGAPLWKWAVEKGFVKEQMNDWGVLREQNFLRFFNRDTYQFLNDAMNYDDFVSYVWKFRDLSEHFCRAPRGLDFVRENYPNLTPASLKPFDSSRTIEGA